MNPNSSFAKAYGVLAKIGTSLGSPLLLLVRLYWGWQFFQTGKAHLANLEKTTAFFADLGIPAPKLNVIMAGGTECLGGLLLLIGLGSRLVSVPLMGTMAVAYATADKEALHALFSDPDKFVTATPFLFSFASVLVFVFGPGRFSVDALLFKAGPTAR